MKKYDVLDIGIKILGLSLIPALISLFGQLIFLFMSDSDELDDLAYYFLVGFILYLIPLWFFIFRSKYIISIIWKVRPDDHPVEFNLNRQALLEIAIVVIGGVGFLKFAPAILSDLIQYSTGGNTNMLLSMLEEILGAAFSILLLICAKPISSYFAGKDMKGENIDTVD